MKLFDLSLKLNGYPIGRAKERLQQIQNITDSEFENYIEKQKYSILNYHLENNEYYQNLVKSKGFSNWEKVPILTKRNLQIPLNDRLSKEFKNKRIYVNKTSGSSGDPFTFGKDKFCHALTWAVIQNRFSWYDLDFNSSLQARFFGIPLDVMGYRKERLKDFFSNRFRFSVFDLSDKAFENCLKVFRTKKFEYMNGYTSPIVQFAKYLMRKEIILKEVCPSLKFCMVTSEMLFDQDKALMEKQFGIPIINEYGASELDLIGFQNTEGNFQLNSETLLVEIVDEHGNLLPKGEEGRIVITSFFNKAHPFIRYDIGDIGVIDEMSTSKKPILKKLIGRTNDIAYLPSGKTAAGLTFYYITKSIIEDDGVVKEFIIEQLKKELFKVHYVSNEPLTEEKLNFIRSEMIKYLEPGITIEFNRLDKLERSKSGKLKQFISHINIED